MMVLLKLQFNQISLKYSENLRTIKQMQNENRKKKKSENYKVLLAQNKLQGLCFLIKQIENAYFPYEPYPEQVALMQRINEGIKNYDNALIESPTGTGKTLCMLVGSLSCLCQMTSSLNVKVPKIYYLTRTHSQITQVVNQLKRISWYQLKLNIIASRQHLCINRNLKELKGRMLDRGCQEMCKQKLCKYKEQISQNSIINKEWLTLQELCQKGNKKGFCPFYSSKMATQKCELTIMPFNYLLDWSLLENNNLNLKNSIIIFDEAHNVDSLAEEGSSMEIDTDMLAQCLVQLKNLEQSSKCRYLHKKFEEEHQQSDYALVPQAKSLVIRMNNCLKQYHQEKNCNNLEDMLSLIRKITNFVHEGQEFKGADLNTYEQILFDLDKVKKLFSQKKVESGQFEIFYSTFTKIMRILDSDSTNIEDYYLYLGPKSSKGFTLKLNCLNASFTFQRISQQKPRSIILCSGTLGSFQIWQKELGINFKTKLRIPSFITSKQIRVEVVEYDLSKNIRYEFSYQHKNRDDQFSAFGEELKEIEKVVPNGVVVAFSTYELMQKCMGQCIGLKKSVFYEAKNENVDKIYSKYSEAARSSKGAFLFIVMKGKFSEGINFNDELCRCLIVVGIPFLPPNDYKVIRKKSYLQSKFGKQAADQWYYSQTFKSVNQVIGRAIRSKQDYACILLFDQRYSRKDILKQLPSWVVTNLPDKYNSNYLQRMNSFFKQQPWLPASYQDNQNPQSSFERLLSKTIVAEDTKTNNFQKLLEQETPVKITKGKKLKIESDDENTELRSIQPARSVAEIEKEACQEETKKLKKVDRYPWLSVDYFIGDQIKDYIIQSKAKPVVKSKQEEGETSISGDERMVVLGNKRRNKKYL